MKASYTLRASELAATLNGDDPHAILKVLQQFVKTVRRERHFSLGLDEDFNEKSVNSDDDNELSDDESNVKPPPSKKYKRSEKWKADLASYDVPFVGTAVARGEYAEVNRGEWPTGLIKLYLEKSPFAVELMNDDLRFPNGLIHRRLTQKKNGRLSYVIAIAHLLALSELLTVAIPKSKYEKRYVDETDIGYNLNNNGIEPTDKTDRDKMHTKLLAEFIKKTLPWVFEILNEETGNGRGKLGTKGGCGTLVATALKILRNVSSISTQNARLVARKLDEKLSEGVLRMCLRPMPVKKEETVVPSTGAPFVERVKKPCRTEAIKLACTLLQAEDIAVNTYICTGGSKGRKVAPGLLYLTLREGISIHSKNDLSQNVDFDDDYFNSVMNLFNALRVCLFKPTIKFGHTKVLIDLITRDVLSQLCRLSSYAPSLSSLTTYYDVLKGTDSYSRSDGELTDVGIEARRLLFTLLYKSSTSSSTLRLDGDLAAKALFHLLELPNTSRQLQKFIVDCLKKGPFLIKNLFRWLTIPDPSKSFEFIDRINFITTILRMGPPALDCVTSTGYNKTKLQVKSIMLTFFPEKLNSCLLAAALQHGNSLVLFETLKFMLVSMDRFKMLLSEVSEEFERNNAFAEDLLSAFIEYVPGFQLLLSIRHRVDLKDKKMMLLSDLLFQVIEMYIDTFPDLAEIVSSDWIKLLPGNYLEFNKAANIMQIRMLRCLKKIMLSSQKKLSENLLSSKIVFEIMLSTRSKVVYGLCVDICTKLMTSAFTRMLSNDQSLDSIEKEILNWIDALTQSALSDLFELFGNVLTNFWKHISLIGKSWQETGINGEIVFTPLLAAALFTDDDTECFSVMIGQIAARSMIQLRDPLPLAAVAVYASTLDHSIAKGKYMMPLIEYSQMLLQFDETDIKMREKCFYRFLDAYFPKDSFYIHVFNHVTENGLLNSTGELQFDFIFSRSHVLERFLVVQFLIHTVIVLGSDEKLIKRYWDIMHHFVPFFLLRSMIFKFDNELFAILDDVYARQAEKCSLPFEKFEVMVSSFQFSPPRRFVHRRLSASGRELAESREGLFDDFYKRSRLLFLYLTKKQLCLNVLHRVQLRLIGDTRDAMSCLGVKVSCFFEASRGYFGETDEIDSDILKLFLNAWTWLARNRDRVEVFVLERVTASLCEIAREFLKKNSLASSKLVILIGMEADIIVDLCLDLSAHNTYFLDRRIEVLRKLLKIDFCRFSQPVVSCLQQMLETPDNSAIWERKCLPIVNQLILCTQTLNSEITKKFLNELSSFLIRRLEGALRNNVHGEAYSTLDKKVLCMDTTSKLLKFLGTEVRGVVDLAKAVINWLLAIQKLRNTDVHSSVGIKSLFFLGMGIYNYSKGKEQQFARTSNQVKTALFGFLLTILPPALKASISPESTNTGLNPTEALSLVIALLTSSNGFDNHLLRQMICPTLAKKFCYACLKHGLSAVSTSNAKLISSSLQLLALILRMSFDYGFPIADMIPSSRDIFEKITSHSQFKPTFMEQDANEDITLRGDVYEKRVAIVSLMICCVLNARDDIHIGISTWRTLFVSFNAGLGRLDFNIRTLALACSENSRPYLEDFRWRERIRDEKLDSFSIGKWDWFTDALDLARIHATVSSFPINDTNSVDVTYDTVWGSKTCVNEKVENTNIIAGYAAEELIPGTFGGDIRYSPAFLLPVLLGAVESLCSQTVSDATLDTAPFGGSELSTSAITMIYRICEKGVVSLCLAAISSSCKRVRLQAVAILGLIMRACRTESAQALSSWRYRPQLLMIMDAVQRSLVLRNADRNLNNDVVPRIPPIVGVFLARAAFSISRPNKNVYAPINRYFLKTEADHGAFSDMNRLPAFISLFCPSTDDSEQSLAERIWSLQMIRDGVLDESSFRLVAACHAPELILSSFENVRLSCLSIESKVTEYILLMQSLQAMIEHGGLSAQIYLIRRCGLLSWMGTLSSVDFVQGIFDSQKVRTSFCQLLSVALRAIRGAPELRLSQLLHEICSLIDVLISMCLLEVSVSPGQNCKLLQKSSFCALAEIRGLFSELKQEELSIPEIHPQGAQIESTLKVLQFMEPSHQEMETLTHIICELPISSTCDLRRETVTSFIFFALDEVDQHVLNCGSVRSILHSTTEVDMAFIKVVLRRILLLSKHCPRDLFTSDTTKKSMPLVLISQALDSESNEIVKRIFRLRCCLTFSDIELRFLWLQSLRSVLSSGGFDYPEDDNSLELYLAKELD